MTIKELRDSSETFITPKQAADILECDPQQIRDMAAQRPELLGFPVVRLGSRTKIPRIPFIKFISGE